MAHSIPSQNWLEAMIREYDQPNRILFRSIELNTIFKNLNIKIASPALDLGCGDGKITKVLFGKAIDVGLDNLREEINKAKAETAYRWLITGDAVKLPFAREKFNFVFSNSVIEHIKDNANVLKEVARILKPQGIFVFTVPSENFGNYLYFFNLFKNLGLTFLANRYRVYRNQTVNHYHCYSPQEWKQRLKRAGLSLVKHQYYLSKEAISYWDLLAFEAFLISRCVFWQPKDRVFSRLKTLRMPQWRKKLEYHYNLNDHQSCNQEGGALLIIAQK